MKLAQFKVNKASYNFSNSSTFYSMGTLPSPYRPITNTPIVLNSVHLWGVAYTDGAVKIARENSGSEGFAGYVVYHY